MTEPYTYGGRITSLIYTRSKAGELPPRAGILASRDTQVTAMDSWYNKDCAVALAKIE